MGFLRLPPPCDFQPSISHLHKDQTLTLHSGVAGLQGRVDQLEEANKQLTEERDQFLERYYRLVTQFELMGGSFERARAGITDSIGYLRGRPDKHDQHETPSLPPAKVLTNGNGQLEQGFAKIAESLGGPHQPTD